MDLKKKSEDLCPPKKSNKKVNDEDKKETTCREGEEREKPTPLSSIYHNNAAPLHLTGYGGKAGCAAKPTKKKKEYPSKALPEEGRK